MSSKKYVKDYRSIETVDSKGRIRKEYEYIGGSFIFLEAAEVVRRRAKLLAVLCAAGWIFWLLPLLFPNGAMRLPFISVPFIFSALTLWMLSMSAFTAATAQEPMKHKRSARLTKWLPGTSLATAILVGVALIGTAVAYLFSIGNLNAYDWLYAGCAVMLCADAFICFTQRSFFRMEER